MRNRRRPPGRSEPKPTEATSASSGRRLADTSAEPTIAPAANIGARRANVGHGSRSPFCIMMAPLGVDDALHDGGGGGGADLAHRRQLVGVVFPRRIGRIDVLRRPGRGQLGLVGERVGLLEIADDAVADGDRQGRDERDDAAEQRHQIAHRHRPIGGRPARQHANVRALASLATDCARRAVETAAAIRSATVAKSTLACGTLTCGSPQGSVPLARSIEAGS